MSASVWTLAAARTGTSRPGRKTIAALAVVWAYVFVSLVSRGAFAFAALVGVFAGPTLGLLALAVLAIRALLVARSQRALAEKWRDHAGSALWLGWAALLIGIPASLSYAWLRGADPFCF